MGEQIVFENEGFCAVCMSATRFVARNQWLRDHYLCERCNSIPRQRALIEVLNIFRPDWRSLRIHESSPSISFFAQQCLGYTCSFFFEDVPVGTLNNGNRCENLEALTFEAESFDIFITQDVLEHVFHPDQALSEIMRVLRSGGVHIFTAPKHKHLLKSVQRAKLAGGAVVYLEEPSYHGNPIGDGRSLVTWDYGADFDDLIQSWSGYATSNFIIRDRGRGIDGEYLDVFVTVKDPVNRFNAFDANEGLRSPGRDTTLNRSPIQKRTNNMTSLAAQRNKIHSLWNSWSWRMFRPLRNLMRRIGGHGIEAEPVVGSVEEAARTIAAIRGSLSWKMTSPLRAVHRGVTQSDDVQKWSRLQPIIERQASRFSVSPAIHPEDHMFGFTMQHPHFDSDEARVGHYFADGANSARQFTELLRKYCGQLGRKPQVLEFASGYGCVARHLLRDNGIDLESCDIHPAAVDFLQTRIKVRALQSSAVPEMVSFPHEFDMVFALSFFSHMPISTWTRWLVRLTQCLRPGGVVAFTTHGIACRVLCGDPEIPLSGFWFMASSEQADLPAEEYGSSIVTEEFVRRSVSSIPSVEVVETRLAYWWGLQDLYVLRKTG